METRGRVLKPSITVNNVIRFPRLVAQNIVAYEVKVQEEVREDVYAKYSLPIIENPVSANPIEYIETFQYNYGGIYQLPDETYYSIDYPITIYVDDNPIDDLYITFNENTKTVRINTKVVNINGKDIKIKYFKDMIEVTHSTTNKCIYTVEPVLNTEYMLGSHSVLK